MNQTENYQLNQWDGSDRILRTDFNADNAKLDAALKSHADSISSLSTQMAGKASTSTVNSLSSQLSRKGNCQIWTTTYTGTGQFGEEHPNSITFSSKPALFYITSDYGAGYYIQGSRILWVRAGSSTVACYGSWSGNTYTWSNQYLDNQLNAKGVTYTVVALLPQD